MNGDYKYGFRLQQNGKAYEIYVDENMNPTNKDKNNEFVKQLVNENKEELDALFNNANGKFQLN